MSNIPIILIPLNFNQNNLQKSYFALIHTFFWQGFKKKKSFRITEQFKFCCSRMAHTNDDEETDTDFKTIFTEVKQGLNCSYVQ